MLKSKENLLSWVIAARNGTVKLPIFFCTAHESDAKLEELWYCHALFRDREIGDVYQFISLSSFFRIDLYESYNQISVPYISHKAQVAYKNRLWR